MHARTHDPDTSKPRAVRRPGAWALASLSACLLTTPALGDSPSFGGIFFWSGRADGGIDWIGSSLIWFLIALSIANVGLVVKLWLDHDRRSIVGVGLADRVRGLVLTERYVEALAAARDDESDLGRILHATLSASTNGTAAMARAMEQTADDSLAKRLRQLERLNVLGQVSPMIGLFGTVYGMIVAFQTIAASGGAADPVLLAGGIGTALVTTFWGLLIAIPALAVYATLRNRVDAASAEAEREAESVLELFRAKRGAPRDEADALIEA